MECLPNLIMAIRNVVRDVACMSMDQMASRSTSLPWTALERVDKYVHSLYMAQYTWHERVENAWEIS
jgi:hypothetical protein